MRFILRPSFLFERKGEKKMKRLVFASILGLGLAVALGFGLIPPIEQTASCADCNQQMAQHIKKDFGSFNIECDKLVPDFDYKNLEKCFEDKTYTKIIAKRKPVMNKTRTLFVGEKLGNVFTRQLPRNFWLTGVPLAKKTMTVSFGWEKKQTGFNLREGVTATICAVDKDGKYTSLGTISWDSHEDFDSEGKELKVTDVAGKFLQIEVGVSSNRPLPNKFKYTLEIKN
jgi:hypothetical protein